MAMTERHQLILAELEKRSRATVADLATVTGCSEMTIRRDLDHLENGGALRRVHGGAVSVPLTGVESPFTVRAVTGKTQKRRLGKAAADMLADGEAVIADSGTTVLEAVRAMRGRQLTVAPLSLHAAEVLGQFEGVSMVMPGGQVRPRELSLYGDLAERSFAELRFDTYLLGCCGLDEIHGVTVHVLEDARVKRAALASARRVIALVTSDKIGRVAFGKICSISRLDTVITDSDATHEQREELRRAGARLVVV